MANRIKQLMEAAGLNTQQLADKVGVERPSVSRWINGKASPVGRNLEALAIALGASESYLAGYSPSPPHDPALVLIALTKAEAAYEDLGLAIAAIKSMIEPLIKVDRNKPKQKNIFNDTGGRIGESGSEADCG